MSTTTDFLHETAAAARRTGDESLAVWLDTAATDAETGTGAAITDEFLHDAVNHATQWVADHRSLVRA